MRNGACADTSLESKLTPLLRFGRRDSAGSQVMMRGRIVAQAFTVGALMVGVGLNIKNKTWVKPSSQEEFQAAASNTK